MRKDLQILPATVMITMRSGSLVMTLVWDDKPTKYNFLLLLYRYLTDNITIKLAFIVIFFDVPAFCWYGVV